MGEMTNMTDMTNMPGGQGQCTVQDVMAVMEEAYPPDFAEQWDHPGLVCGDPTAFVKHVCCAVDLTPATLDAALAEHAQMVITHHPVLFDSVHSVAANTPKGKLIHRAISAGCALFCAHTNADSANPGVNDALAEALGLTVTGPLIPHSPGNNGDKHAPGLGRIGTLTKPLTLREFTNVVAASLPRTVWGIRAAGDPQTRIETVAVCGGSGGSFLDVVREAGVDCYVTSDLRHHPVDDFLQAGGTAVIDTAHAASEYPWLAQVAQLLHTQLGIDVTVLPIVTDPWTLHAPSQDS